MIDATLSAFGRIDILFNNAVHSAASSEPSERDLMAFDTSVFERIVRVNVLGGVWACKYALPHMLSRGMGAILFTSSTRAFAGEVGQFPSGASKAMVERKRVRSGQGLSVRVDTGGSRFIKKKNK